MRLLVAWLAALLVASTASAQPLALEAKIPLGAVSGRIDHLAIDDERRLLFVAELGNDSVGIVDLSAAKVLRRLTGLREPQGVAWHAATGTLYVANAGDGSVRLFQAPDFAPIGQIALGYDADNIRLDRRRDRLVVGYGKGGFAVIDPVRRAKVGDIALRGHPESFQLDEQGRRIFANVPDARQVAVIDVEAGRQVESFDPGGARGNFPMALDAEVHRLLVVTRSPARLHVLATQEPKPLTGVETCGDADDVFVDARRKRVYVVCGQGAVDVFARTTDSYVQVARISTVAGARTGLFDPTTDRLYVAVRAASGEPASVWVFRPGP